MSNRTIAITAAIVLCISFIGIGIMMFSGESRNATSRSTGQVGALPITVASTNVVIDTGQLPVAQSVLTNRYARRPGTMDVTIDFWGRVVDEQSKPVAGAKVVVSMRSWGKNFSLFFRDARFSEETLVTDEHGRFALSNRLGDSLGIDSITKQGYTMIKGQEANFSFGRPGSFIPRIDQPQMFMMISENTLSKSRLKKFEILTRIGCENGIIGFNLDRGTRTINQANGEINAYFSRMPTKLTDAKDKFDWNLRIEVPGGGIARVNEVESGKGFSQVSLGQMIEAPRSGYLPVHELKMAPDDIAWKRNQTITFYFKTGTNFGKAVLGINAGATAETTPLSLRGALNPTGSTLLAGE